MRWSRVSGSAITIVGAALLGLGAEALAQGIEPVGVGQATVTVTCIGDVDSRTSTEAIVTLACDRFVEPNTSSALAEAYLDTPEVFAQTFTVGPVSAIATSIITWKIRVNQSAIPPVPTTIVDVGAFKSGEVSLFGSSFGTVRASLDGPMHDNTTLALGPPDFDNERISVALERDEIYTVTLRAQCQSAAGGTCVAILDPPIFLDQDAFDLRMGASTYPLADYYALEISANIGPGAIPTFPGWAVLVAALSLLFAVAWAGRPSTSRVE